MHRNEGLYNINNLFSDTIPPSCLEAPWLNAVQEEICKVIEMNGLTVKDKSANVNDQLLQAILKNVVYSSTGSTRIVKTQAQFNDLFTSGTGTIKDGIYHIHLIYNGADYKAYGSDFSVPAGAALNTNQCGHLSADGKVKIDFGTYAGYLNVNTAGCLVENIRLTGGTSGSGYGHMLMAAENITFLNCKVINPGGAGFLGGNYVTGKMIGCYVEGLLAGNSGFYQAYNLSDCVVYGGATTVYHFNSCHNLVNCTSIASIYIPFLTCNQLSGCVVKDISLNTAAAFYGLFKQCYNLSSCRVENVTNAGNSEYYGFESCYNLSACHVYDLETAGSVYGFYACYNVSACEANKLDGATVAAGFSSSYNVTGCKAIDIDATTAGGAAGFLACNCISGCFADDIDTPGAAYGFKNCIYGSALYSAETASGNTFCNSAAGVYSMPAAMFDT